MTRISGPMIDRFDLTVEMPPVTFDDQDLPSDTSATVATRVSAAFQIQADRYRDHPGVQSNADLEGVQLTEVATLDSKGQAMPSRAAELFRLSARGGIIGCCVSSAPSLIWLVQSKSR